MERGAQRRGYEIYKLKIIWKKSVTKALKTSFFFQVSAESPTPVLNSKRLLGLFLCRIQSISP